MIRGPLVGLVMSLAVACDRTTTVADVSCTTDADCARLGAFFCEHAACDAPAGVCREKPALATCPTRFPETCEKVGASSSVCTTDAPYVCGCNHQTYQSACEATAMGVSVAAAGLCPPLPSGPCSSQEDCGGASFASLVFCKPTVCGAPAGTCTSRPVFCEILRSSVCGCDGVGYSNTCGSNGAGVGIAYAGPCRSGAAIACDVLHPCANRGICVNDPRATCAGDDCPGVCLTATDYGGFTCGPSASTDEGEPITIGCSDGVCVATQARGCASPGGVCGACVFGSDTPCDAGTPCPTGQLCTPTVCDPANGPCPSVCVRP